MGLGRFPIYVLLMFTAVYMVAGDSDSPVWSGLYFLSNYLIMVILFLDQKDKTVRLLGVSLSLAILVFIIAKFFITLEADNLRWLNAFIFMAIFLGLFKLEQK